MKEGEKDRKRGKYIEGALAGFICISVWSKNEKEK